MYQTLLESAKFYRRGLRLFSGTRYRPV